MLLDAVLKDIVKLAAECGVLHLADVVDPAEVGLVVLLFTLCKEACEEILERGERKGASRFETVLPRELFAQRLVARGARDGAQ